MERELEQKGFSIVTQILEFWQENYFDYGINYPEQEEIKSESSTASIIELAYNALLVGDVATDNKEQDNEPTSLGQEKASSDMDLEFAPVANVDNSFDASNNQDMAKNDEEDQNSSIHSVSEELVGSQDIEGEDENLIDSIIPEKQPLNDDKITIEKEKSLPAEKSTLSTRVSTDGLNAMSRSDLLKSINNLRKIVSVDLGEEQIAAEQIIKKSMSSLRLHTKPSSLQPSATISREVSKGHNELKSMYEKEFEKNLLDYVDTSKYKYGKFIDAKLKSDGAWNFHTLHKQTLLNEKQVKFQTTFYRPTSICPIPKATACVWFTLTKNEITEGWNLKYRYEHHYQVHNLDISKDAPTNGLNNEDIQGLQRQAKQLASPLIRMSQVIQSKCLTANQFKLFGPEPLK